MAKYTDKLVERIISLIEEDSFSISEICSTLKISRKTFYEWKETKPEFRIAIEKATEQRDDKLLMIARRSLKKKLEGYTLTETRTTYIPDKNDPEKLILKSQVVKQKEYAPDAQAIKLMISKNEQKKESNKGEKNPSPLTIIVQNPEAAVQLNQLREDLINGKMNKKKVESETDPTPSKQPNISSNSELSVDGTPPSIPEKEEPTPPARVRDYTVPPGYLYRG